MAPANEWRVMTWNVHGSSRPDLGRVADIVRQQHLDVLALQEIRVGQARSLAQRLGWRHEWARKHFTYTPALWWLAEGAAVLSPHDLGDRARRTLSSGESSWSFRHRIVLAATVRRAGSTLRVYDTHLAAHGRPDARIEQAGRLASMIADERAKLAVVAGDLNASGELEVIRQLHPVGLRDPGGGPTHPSMTPRSRLDYVLLPDAASVSDRFEPDGGDDWRSLSDHLPVLVEFTVG